MQEVRSRDSGSLSTELYLVGVVLGDKSGFKSNARLVVKSKFVPSELTELEVNPSRIVECFPSFYFDFGESEDAIEHFRSSFDFSSSDLVKALQSRFVADRSSVEHLKRQVWTTSRWRKLARLRKKLESQARAKSKKVDSFFDRLALPGLANDCGRKGRYNKSSRLWKWQRSHPDICGFFQRLSRPSPWQLLIDNVAHILKLFEKGYCDLSIANQLKTLQLVSDDFCCISASTYRSFLNECLCLKYGAAKIVSKNCDSDENKRLRRIASISLLYVLSQNITVLFYDETIISPTSFRSAVWRNASNRNFNIERKTSTGTIKLLLATTAERVVNFWIAKKSNSEVTCAFLDETVDQLRADDENARVVIFLDNSTMHKTKLMQSWCRVKEVYSLFNAPHSSKSMLVEYLFEKVKREFRSRTSKNKKENLAKTLHAEAKRIEPRDVRIAFEKSLEWTAKAIANVNFWVI